ncbi:hypothetical protein BDN70DRAFT_519096 [Pholiota conissans]|uniref:Uncharacterized protein n=1 Tax=Pholiota conissans TaxID=109636 RepID=A0A9P5Z917_9AGAR|nr:hypothetical protein BDN70DRAFT_519096 [Pholiota conissans]
MPNLLVPSYAVLRQSLPLMTNNLSLDKLRTSRLLDASAVRYRHPSSNPFARRSFQPQHISAMPILSTSFQLEKRHSELSLILFQRLLKDWNLTTAAFADCATFILNFYSEILENNADDEVSAHKRVYRTMRSLLENAPCIAGKRYVAICVCLAEVIAGELAVLQLGRSWCDNLLHPSKSIPSLSI